MRCSSIRDEQQMPAPIRCTCLVPWPTWMREVLVAAPIRCLEATWKRLASVHPDWRQVAEAGPRRCLAPGPCLLLSPSFPSLVPHSRGRHGGRRLRRKPLRGAHGGAWTLVSRLASRAREDSAAKRVHLQNAPAPASGFLVRAPPPAPGTTGAARVGPTLAGRAPEAQAAPPGTPAGTTPMTGGRASVAAAQTPATAASAASGSADPGSAGSYKTYKTCGLSPPPGTPRSPLRPPLLFLRAIYAAISRLPGSAPPCVQSMRPLVAYLVLLFGCLLGVRFCAALAPHFAPAPPPGPRGAPCPGAGLGRPPSYRPCRHVAPCRSPAPTGMLFPLRPPRTGPRPRGVPCPP